MRAAFCSTYLSQLPDGEECVFFPMSHERANSPFRVFLSYVVVQGGYHKLSPADNTEACWLLWVERSRPALSAGGVDRVILPVYGFWRMIYSSTYIGWIDLALPVNLLLDVDETVNLYYHVNPGQLNKNHVSVAVGGYVFEGPDLDLPEAQLIKACTPILPFMQGQFACSPVAPGVCV